MTPAVTPRLSIRDLDLARKRLFLRADFNVPLQGARITDDTRLRETLPTIRLALDKGASLVIGSHLGRPKGGPDEKTSLAPVAAALGALLDRRVALAPDCVGAETESLARALRPGDVLLLQNLRWHAEEQKGDAAFAERLAALADAYANDAFGTCHRGDASVAVLPRRFDRAAAGLLVERELEALARVLTQPRRPFVAVLGGAKVSDKLPVMRGLLPRVDVLLIGGAMAYTLLAAQGAEVGASRVERDMLDDVRNLLGEAQRHGKLVVLPVDHVVAAGIAPQDAGGARTVAGAIVDGMGVDIGPRTRELFGAEIQRARTILWNGPMGVFEVAAFSEGTRAIAESVAAADAFSVVGGGDSIAALNAAGLASRVGHVSTGGGALLELLAGDPMPGLEALTPAGA